MSSKRLDIKLQNFKAYLQETEKTTPSKQEKREQANKHKSIVKAQYEEIAQYQNTEINEENKKKLENLILATEILISDSKDIDFYYGNKDENFVNLIYIYQRLTLKLESYKIEKEIQNINEKNKEIEEKQKRLEKNGNDLVYNLLGFLTSFSIISASIEAIGKIDGIINIMIFITFVILILVTTLIALHNFYKNENKRNSKLQDNYFLWKIIVGILILLIVISGITYIHEKKDTILNYLNEKTENVIERKVEEILKDKEQK